MIVADVLTWVFLILALLLAFPAYWMMTRALFPAHVARMEGKLRERPVTAFLVGIGVSFGAALVLGAIGAAPVGFLKGISVLGFALLGGFGLMGSGALAGVIGAGMSSARDAEQPWRAALRGAIALELTFLLPILGWIVLMFGSAVLGVGLNTLALFGGRKAAVEPQAQPHPEVRTAAPAAQPAQMAGAATP